MLLAVQGVGLSKNIIQSWNLIVHVIPSQWWWYFSVLCDINREIHGLLVCPAVPLSKTDCQLIALLARAI